MAILNKRFSLKRSYYLIWVLCIFVVQGCPFTYGPHPDYAPPHLQKITGRANTFRLITHTYPGWDEGKNKVHGIRVYDISDAYHGKTTNYWEIKATNPVTPEGFEVTVGRIPANFFQITPQDNEVFKSKSGEYYYIAVYIGDPIWNWISTTWQAD
jgi:hypothetical protein